MKNKTIKKLIAEIKNLPSNNLSMGETIDLRVLKLLNKIVDIEESEEEDKNWNLITKDK